MQKITRKWFSLLGLMAFMLLSGNIYSQDENIVTGKVFPAGMNTPMSGVSVQIKGNEISKVITDGNGFFKINVTSFPVDLEFSKATYETYTATVKKAADITVNLTVLETTKNDYGQDVGIKVALNPESRDGILMFSSTDNRFKYWFDTRIMFDGASYFGDNTYQGDENKIGNGVSIRRARFAMKVLLWGNWGGEIDLDFANNEMELKDAYVRYIRNNWQIKAGNFREPFSLETMTTSRYLTFLERPYATEMAPSRHMGIDYKININHLFFEGGLFSTKITNPLIRDQNKSKGTNAGWAGTARMAWAPIKKDQQVLHFGAAGSYRTPLIPELGDPENSFRYAENAETEINRKKYIDTDWVEYCQREVLIGLEAAYAVKNFRFQSEYITSNIQRDVNKVPDGEDKVKKSGYYIMGAWLINNANYYYNMSDAEFSQIDFKDYKKGALEAALRYSYMNANTFKDGEDKPYIPGGSGEVYTAGLTYYFNYNVKIMLDYSYANHDRWADGKGKYKTFDINDKGDDITPKGKGGIDYSTIMARIQIAF